MQQKFHMAARYACRTVLRPLVKMISHCQMSYSEFAEVAKEVFVEIASEASHGAASVSSISVRTGISRKQVKKLLRPVVKDENYSSNFGLHLMRVLALWTNSEQYLDGDGQPLSLEYYSEDGACLKGLIGSLAVDIPASAVLKELIATESVTVDDQGRYYPTRSSVIGVSSDPDVIVQASLFVAAHLHTVVDNIFSDSSESMFERHVSSIHISQKDYDRFREHVRIKGDEFIASLQSFVASIESAEPSRKASTTTLWVGVYSFNKDFNKELEHSAFAGFQEWNRYRLEHHAIK